VKARADEGLLRAAGQATAIFYGIDPQALESGVAVALPGDRAAKVILYGLQAPPEGQRYTLAARGPDGTLTPLRDVPVGGDGSAFLLARDIPERTAALELVLRDASLGPVGGEPEAGGKGQAGAGAPPGSPISLEGATPRVAARYPAEDERGVLTQAPAVQARRAAR